MILNVKISKRIATYISTNEKPVCGNSGDQIKFEFDKEWAEHDAKTARIEWNGRYFDVEFTGDTCELPVITNTGSIKVGVYVGDTAAEEPQLSTTKTEIPYKVSVRCNSGTAHPKSNENYTNEAKGAAAEAKAAAESAQNASTSANQSSREAFSYKETASSFANKAQSCSDKAKTNANAAAEAEAEAKAAAAEAKAENGKLEPKIAHNSVRIEKIEDKLGLDGDIVKIESMYTPNDQYGNPHFFNANMYRYVRILKLGSKGVAVQNPEYGNYEYTRQYIDHIDDSNINTQFSFPSGVLSKCPDFGVGNSDSERYANYIFFEGGKAYYHQGCRFHFDSNEAELAEGENVVEDYFGDGMHTQIVGLAEPIITDISEHWDFDGVIDVGVDYGEALLSFYPNTSYGDGYIEFAYMTKEGA